MPHKPRHVLIAANPRSGSNQGVEYAQRLAASLSERGFSAIVETNLDEFTSVASRYHSAGDLCAVVACGGDGTVMSVVNRVPADTPVAVFPLGNANLLATYLKIRRDVEQLTEIITAGETRVLDAASAGGQLFMLVAGIGFDAEVVRRFHATRTGPVSHAGYLWPIWQALSSYHFRNISADCELPDGSHQMLTGGMIVVTNIPQYAEGFQFSPDADPTDGLLDICSFDIKGSLGALWYAPWVRLGMQAGMPGCTMTRCRRVSLAPAENDAEIPFQLDGDPGGNLPVEISVVPQRLTLLAPPGEKYSRG